MRPIVRLVPLLVAACVVASQTASAGAQVPPAVEDHATPPQLPTAVPLVAGSPSLTGQPESWVKIGKSFIAHNVSKPTLTPFLPEPGKANGTAVIIAPGGGFMMLSMSSEGWDVARWLAANGVAAFVLKYRLVETPDSAAGTMATMASRLGDPKREEASWFADGRRVAVEDALAAMRLVRADAARWKIDPSKLGFMGFSAGAFTTLGLVDKADRAAMPDFVVPIYGSLNTPATPLPASVPPMWTSIAADDAMLGKTDFGLINAWRSRGGSVEFHLYDRGGHGYGFAGTPTTTTVNWPTHLLAWLQSRGLAPSPAEAKP